MEPINLIITVPHAKCDFMAKKRGCDFAAALAGKSICNALNKCKLKYVYFQGNEFRCNYDLNRKPSRSTKYRTALESVIKNSSSNNSLLLDIHSFPDYYMDEAGDINFFAKNEVAPDIVFLQGPNNTFNEVSLTESLFASIKKAELKTKIIKGIIVNDIMNNANEYSIPAVLLEFNEKYNKDPEKLDRICELIVRTIRDICKA